MAFSACDQCANVYVRTRRASGKLLSAVVALPSGPRLTRKFAVTSSRRTTATSLHLRRGSSATVAAQDGEERVRFTGFGDSRWRARSGFAGKVGFS